MHHRMVYLLRAEDDEAPVDLVGVEIVDIAQIFRHLRRKSGAVDIDPLPCCWGQTERPERLVVALDQMRFLNGKKPAIDQLIVTQKVHQAPHSPLAFKASMSAIARSRKRASRTSFSTATSSDLSE